MNKPLVRQAPPKNFSWLRFSTAFAVLFLAFVLVRATSVIPPDFAQLVNESDYIVRAVVKSVTSEWRGSEGHRHILTLVELDVREVIKGTPPQPLVLEMLGGRVGQDAMTIAGAPKFKVGDEDILFVEGNGRNAIPLFAIMHGRYPIMKEAGTGRQYMARGNHEPMQDTAEVALPIEGSPATQILQQKGNTASALTPAQFVERIKTAVDPSYHRAQQN